MDLPPIGFGTYGLRGETCRAAVETALEAGYRHVDTARMYGNEAAVGAALAASDVPRDEVVVATKVWHDSLAPDQVRESALASREALGVDTLDLLYVHWPRGNYDAAETLPAFDALREEGVVDHVGLSNFTPALLDEAERHLDAPVAAHQVELHPLLQQDELRARAERDGHRLVAYCPVARNRVAEVPEVRAVAERHDATPAQVSLAWVRQRGAVPLPRSGTTAHVRENLASLDLTLEEADLRRIDGIDREERLVDPSDAPWR